MTRTSVLTGDRESNGGQAISTTLDASAFLARHQLLESGIAIHLQDALESLQMRDRALGLSARAVDVDGRPRIGPAPWSIVPRIRPTACRSWSPATARFHRPHDRPVARSTSLPRHTCRGGQIAIRLGPTRVREMAGYLLAASQAL